MTTAELAAVLVSPSSEGLPLSPDAAAFAVARTVALTRSLEPDLVIPLPSADRGFGQQVELGLPTAGPLMLRRAGNGCLRLPSDVLQICNQAERPVLVSEVLCNGREAGELLTMLALRRRAVGVVVLWDKRTLRWPTIAGVPVHALYSGRVREVQAVYTRAGAIRGWLGTIASRLWTVSSSLENNGA